MLGLGWSVLLGLQPVQVFGRSIGGGSGGEDGLLVALHDLEPMRDVVRVVVSQGRYEAQVGTKENEPKFGFQHFGATIVPQTS